MKCGVVAISSHAAILPDSAAGGGGGTWGTKSSVDRVRDSVGGQILTSSLVFSAMTLCNPIPTPSITAKNIAHIIAPFRAAFKPPLIASEPPVRKPAMIELYGSSFFLMPLTAQSNVLNYAMISGEAT
jgi:hypothetical protein